MHLDQSAFLKQFERLRQTLAIPPAAGRSASVLSAHGTGGAGVGAPGWATSPWWMVCLVLVVCVALRLRYGRSNYMWGVGWLVYMWFVSCFVSVVLLTGLFTMPATFDGNFWMHAGFALAYAQLDLALARAMVGRGLGSWNAPWLVVKSTPKAMVVLFVCLCHQIFFNVFLQQNFIDEGYPRLVGMLSVPILNSLFHAIVSNAMVGLRTFPTYLAISLSYSASANVLVPVFLHMMLSCFEGKFLATYTMRKRGDKAEREITSWDNMCTMGLLLALCFYVPLNIVAASSPQLRSARALEDAAFRRVLDMRHHVAEIIIALIVLVQAFFITWQWQLIRPIFAHIGDTGEEDPSPQTVRAIVAGQTPRDVALFLAGLPPNSAAARPAPITTTSTDSLGKLSKHGAII